MCNREAETHSHLFVHCPVAEDIWYMFLTLFGLKWVMPNTIREVFESWSRWKVDSTIKNIWKMIPAAIFWTIWNERNRRCFDGLSTSQSMLKARCLLYLYSWVFLSPMDSPDSFLDFICSMVMY